MCGSKIRVQPGGLVGFVRSDRQGAALDHGRLRWRAGSRSSNCTVRPVLPRIHDGSAGDTLVTDAIIDHELDDVAAPQLAVTSHNGNPGVAANLRSLRWSQATSLLGTPPPSSRASSAWMLRFFPTDRRESILGYQARRPALAESGRPAPEKSIGEAVVCLSVVAHNPIFQGEFKRVFGNSSGKLLSTRQSS